MLPTDGIPFPDDRAARISARTGSHERGSTNGDRTFVGMCFRMLATPWALPHTLPMRL